MEDMDMLSKRIVASVLSLLLISASFTGAKSFADGAGDVSGSQVSQGTSEERLYGVGSVSKVYVTAAVMQLADKGLVDIEAPLTTYIPEFRMADPRYTKITVRMLMDHTSGIMGTQNKDMDLYGSIKGVPYDELLSSLSRQRLKADPGEYAAYCNDGFCLLAMVVEKVSGMSYTDYVVKNIAGKIGCGNTGTPVNMYGHENSAPIYKGYLPYDYEYCLAYGSGGIYATASDVAEFGSTFWKGDNRLLSESAKDKMATCWDRSSRNDYQDGSGLGWDYVEQVAYEREGVKVVGKGGDLQELHAHLLVAPDNDVSVSVLSSGGSSTFDQLVAEALLDVALEEQGITIDHSTESVETVDQIPEEFKKYEGNYIMYSMGGNVIAGISFPDSSHMEVAVEGIDKTETGKYMYTTEGGFAEVNDYGRVKNNGIVVFFEDGEDGKTYIKGGMNMNVPELGTSTRRMYVGESVNANPVSDEVKAAYETYSSTPWVLSGDSYSSASYLSPFMMLKVSDKCPGYVIGSVTMYSCVFKIDDAGSVSAFTTMPSSANRDLVDGHITPEGTFECSNGMVFRALASVPEFTADISEVQLNDASASWYRISDDMANSVLMAERPENSTICVFNKYFELIYSTHVKDASEKINLPEGGYIMFAGENGGVVKIDK